MKRAVLDMGHAGCVSCKRAIEHAGRHIAGIKDIEVDLASHKINVSYDETNNGVTDSLINVVGKIGYEAVLISEETV